MIRINNIKLSGNGINKLIDTKAMIVARDILINGWESLGLKKGDCLMVHSSIKSLGTIIEQFARVNKVRASQIIVESLFDVLGNKGTVVMPALSGTKQWFNKPAEKRSWNINIKTTTSTLCEEFRKMPGVKRSIHPTHSVVAKGPLAEWLIKDHLHSKTPCGMGSPYEKLRRVNAYILLIGVGLGQCTFIHHLEEVFNIPGHIDDDRKLKIAIEGFGVKEFTVHAIEGPYFNWNLNDFEKKLIDEGIMVQRTVGKAKCLLIKDINKMTDISYGFFRRERYKRFVKDYLDAIAARNLQINKK